MSAKAEPITRDEQEIYVVLVERDTFEQEPDSQPMVLEQYVDQATLSNARKTVASLAGRYGAARIARLEFIDPETLLEYVATCCINGLRNGTGICPECAANVMNAYRMVNLLADAAKAREAKQ